MAKTKRNWAVVGLLLTGALLMVVGLLFPEVFGEQRSHRTANIAGGAAASDAEKPVDDAAKAAAKNETDGDAAAPTEEELPPYGDRDLAQEKAIRGVVRDREGKPVADAIVIAVYKEWRTRPHAVVVASRVRSEPDGVFVLGPLERREYWIVAVKRDVGIGYASNQMPGAWLEVVLAPGASVNGKVTARSGGEPVAGAKIIVKDWAFHQETTTDENGAYLLTPLPATLNAWQGQQLVVVADGFKIAQRSNLLLKSDRQQTVDFALEQGAVLRGKVVDAQTLAPIAGATVGEGWEAYHRTVTTGEDGAFELPNVDISPNRVFTVRADGFLPQQQESDGTGELEFALDSSLKLTGVVQDLRDQPVAGARVYLHRIKPQPQGRQMGNTVATTDTSGKFEFDDVVPGQVAVVAFHKDHAPGEKGPVTIVVGKTPEPVTVMLREGLTVEGEVRDLQDNPLPDIRVQLQKGWSRIKGYKYALNYIWTEMPIWYSDKSGKFKLTGALPGQHWLSAYDKTYGWTGTQLKGVAGQRLTDVIISFAGSTIEGTLTTAEGEPVPGAHLYAQGPKNTPRRSYRWTQTDGLGRFKIGGLKDGQYDLRGNSTFGTPTPLKDIPAGTTGVEMKVQASQTLSGEVMSVRSGRALERFYLSIQPHREQDERGRWRSRGGANWQGWIDTPDGRFERPLTKGVYNLTFKAAGHAPLTLEKIVVEEHIAPQTVYARLDAGSGIKGVATDAEGKPIRNRWIQAQVYRAPGEQRLPSDWLKGGGDRTDSKGRFFIEGVGPGVYLLQLNMGRKGSVLTQVTVAGSEMVEANLQLLPTGYVLFKVTDEEGKPVRRVYFSVYGEGGNYVGWAGWSNSKGFSRSGPLPMGRLTARAYINSQTHDVPSVSFRVMPGKTITVEVPARKKPQ